jgi:hypothetical protein
MTATAHELLAAFESLEPEDKQEVAAEILRRSAGTGDLSGEAFDELAADLFQNYEVEETASGAD